MIYYLTMCQLLNGLHSLQLPILPIYIFLKLQSADRYSQLTSHYTANVDFDDSKLQWLTVVVLQLNSSETFVKFLDFISPKSNENFKDPPELVVS